MQSSLAVADFCSSECPHLVSVVREDQAHVRPVDLAVDAQLPGRLWQCVAVAAIGCRLRPPLLPRCCKAARLQRCAAELGALQHASTFSAARGMPTVRYAASAAVKRPGLPAPGRHQLLRRRQRQCRASALPGCCAEKLHLAAHWNRVVLLPCCGAAAGGVPGGGAVNCRRWPPTIAACIHRALDCLRRAAAALGRVAATRGRPRRYAYCRWCAAGCSSCTATNCWG